jgi:hypothetical protein
MLLLLLLLLLLLVVVVVVVVVVVLCNLCCHQIHVVMIGLIPPIVYFRSVAKTMELSVKTMAFMKS